MPPIPVHIDDPITPTKAKGVTPATAFEAQNAFPPQNATTTTNGQSSYPPARPGAAAMPAPTPYITRPQPEPSRTIASPSNNGPAPPQPGAVPIPPSSSTSSSNGNTLPPPPRAGEATPFTSVLSQMHMPPPSQNMAPTHSTSTAPTSPQRSGPTTLNLGPVGGAPQVTSLASHPPGYQQNVFAQEMSPAQRASLDHEIARERSGSLSKSLLPGFVSEGSSGGLGDDAGVWGKVKGWVGTAGEKVAEVESEVWKRINGQ